MTWEGKKSRWCTTISFSLLLFSPCVSFKLYVMQFGGQGKTCKRIKKLLMILRWFLFFSFCPILHADLLKNPLVRNWMGSSYFRLHDSLPSFPSSHFSFFFFVALDLWIKNTQRHSRRCWIFPVQNVYRSVNKLQRGRRDVITRQKPNSSLPTRECCASNSSSQMGCSCYWYYKFELGYNWKTQDCMLWYYWPTNYWRGHVRELRCCGVCSVFTVCKWKID